MYNCLFRANKVHIWFLVTRAFKHKLDDRIINITDAKCTIYKITITSYFVCHRNTYWLLWFYLPVLYSVNDCSIMFYVFTRHRHAIVNLIINTNCQCTCECTLIQMNFLIKTIWLSSQKYVPYPCFCHCMESMFGY